MRIARPVLTTALLLTVTAGCTASPSASPTTTAVPTAAMPSISASPSSTSTDPEDAARGHAEKLAHDYYALADRLGADPGIPLSELEDVTTSLELDTRKHELAQWRAEEWRQTGRTRVADMRVQSVSLDNTNPAAGIVPTVQVDVCYDVGDVDLVDNEGRSVVGTDRPDRRWERLQIANYDYEDEPADGWRVASLETLEKAPCAG